MLKKIFHDSFENFEITRICMENHASVTGWQNLIQQMLPTFGDRCNRHFGIYGKKFFQELSRKLISLIYHRRFVNRC